MTPTEKAQALRELADWMEKWNAYIETHYEDPHMFILAGPYRLDELHDSWHNFDARDLRRAADQLEKGEA